MVRTAAGFVLTCHLLAGCPLGTPHDHSRPIGHGDVTIDVSPANDTIVFSAVGAGRRDLYLLRLGDLHVTRVAETPNYEVWPSFSPDGRNLVYAAGVPGDRADHIFIRPVRGGEAQQLTHGDANDSSPRFSADDSLIVFARGKNYKWGGLAANWNNGGVICLVDRDGTNERQITPDDVFAYDPHFSADGKSVAFSTVDSLMSVAADGRSMPTRIAGAAGSVPSPDGRLLAYCKGKYAPESKLYVSNADGGSENLVTPAMGYCDRPVFSPASDRIYFLREEWPTGPTGHSKFSLWEVAVDGTGARMIADSGLFDAPLSWKQNATDH